MKPWAKALVSFGVLGLLLTLLPWSELKDAARQASWGMWTLVLVGFLSGHLLGVVKWRMLVNAAGASLSFSQAVRCYAAGLFTNLCLPSIVGGDVLRATLAGRATRRPEVVILVGIADRVIDLAALGFFIAVAGILLGVVVSGWPAQVLTVSAVGGAAVALMALPFLFRRPLRHWPRKVRRKLGRSLVSIRSLRRKPFTAVGAILFSIVIQGSFVLLNAWLGVSIGVDVPWITWFLVWPLAKLSGLIPISLGGLGVRDATLTALLAPFGVPAAKGLLVSLLWQTIVVGGGLLSGAAWWLSRPPGPKALGVATSDRRVGA